MSKFSEAELTFLRNERLLGRVATVGRDGAPHVTPVGMWSVGDDEATIEVRGSDFASTKKFRDVLRTGVAAIVIDDVQPPWHPRAVEVRGRAEAVDGPEPIIRIHADRVVSWGLTD